MRVRASWVASGALYRTSHHAINHVEPRAHEPLGDVDRRFVSALVRLRGPLSFLHLRAVHRGCASGREEREQTENRSVRAGAWKTGVEDGVPASIFAVISRSEGFLCKKSGLQARKRAIPCSPVDLAPGSGVSRAESSLTATEAP